jgi:hypothetical protein
MNHLHLRSCVAATTGRLLLASLLVPLPAGVAAQVGTPKSGVPYDVDKRPNPKAATWRFFCPSTWVPSPVNHSQPMRSPP